MARETNSTEQQYSRYVQGGLTDKHTSRLGWWERREIPRDESDYKMIVRSNEASRPDKISFRAYGTDKYAWLVLQYNNIVDQVELSPGKQILLPHQHRLMLDILNQSTGGKPVT